MFQQKKQKRRGDFKIKALTNLQLKVTTKKKKKNQPPKGTPNS